MTCRSLPADTLAAWVDGALELAEAREVANHVATCRACQAETALLRQEVDALRDALGHDKAPAHLWSRISGQLANQPQSKTWFSAPRARLQQALRPMLGAALAASLLAGVLIFQPFSTPRGAPEVSEVSLAMLAVETAEDYMTFRASQRPLDVASDDPTETLAWLELRVDAALPDIAEQVLEYRLVGGRLCWLMGQRLGALTYARAADTITVYVVPMALGMDTGHDLRPANEVAQHAGSAVRSVVWSGRGLAVAIVSELSDAERARFADAFGQAMNNTYLEI